MLDIADLKTRDSDILNETLREMADKKNHPNPTGDTDLLFAMIEKIPAELHLLFDRDSKQWIFTDVYDEYLVMREYFNRESFVIVERDLNLAIARGIHYRYHKKMSE